MEPTIRHWDGPGLDAWHPWHPVAVAELLSDIDVPWCVVGGWAIELFLGGPHRVHDDVEIAIPRGCFSTLRTHLRDYLLHAVGDGEVQFLPADQGPPADKHQCWVLDQAKGAWRMDIMLEPGDADTWIFRRDERISAPRSRMIDRSGAAAYLRPEGALLYKAKLRRAKDELDFAACLPRMDREARLWLAAALDLAHAEHDWIDMLQRS